MADRDVVRNAIQPSPNIPNLSTGFERPPRLQQRLLKGVLGVRSFRRQPEAVTEQLGAISTHHCLECRLVALARQLHQAAIWLGLKKSQ